MCDSFVASFKNIMLDINALKTVQMIFTRSRSPLPLLNIIINNVQINPSPSTKFLGLELDTKLNWRIHIENKCLATLKLIHSIRRYPRLTWGLDTKNFLTLFNSTILPKLLYSCSVWASATGAKGIKKKIHLRFSPRAPRGSSSGQIFFLHGLPRGLLRGLLPIFLRYEQIFEFQVSLKD